MPRRHRETSRAAIELIRVQGKQFGAISETILDRAQIRVIIFCLTLWKLDKGHGAEVCGSDFGILRVSWDSGTSQQQVSFGAQCPEAQPSPTSRLDATRHDGYHRR
jgi:hypothetical protein